MNELLVKLQKISILQSKLDASLGLSKSSASPNLLFSTDQFELQIAKKQGRKVSEYANLLKQRKKLALFYGNIPQKQLRNIYEKTCGLQGFFAKNFLSLLEQRLDVVVYRSRFAKTIPAARQLITHGKVLVNKAVLTCPSSSLQPGDVISLKSPRISTQLLEQSQRVIDSRELSSVEKFTHLESGGCNTVWTLMTKFLLKKVSARGLAKKRFQPQKLVLACFSRLQRGKVHRNLVLLKLKKHITKKPVPSQFRKYLQFAGIKPLHLEISYKIATLVYLYAPQRVYFPFCVDIDAIRRSFTRC